MRGGWVEGKERGEETMDPEGLSNILYRLSINIIRSLLPLPSFYYYYYDYFFLKKKSYIADNTGVWGPCSIKLTSGDKLQSIPGHVTCLAQWQDRPGRKQKVFFHRG